MIPATIDLPPTLFPVAREERVIEFDLYGLEENHYHFALDDLIPSYGLDSTSNVPGKGGRTLKAFPRTSSSALDQALEFKLAAKCTELDVPSQLAEVKRLLGGSWDLLAGLLGCTRQALHRWSNGEAIADGNRDRLSRLHATVRFIDRGDAEQNRALLDMAVDGVTITELLSEGRFSDVKAAAGRGSGRPDANWGKVERPSVPAEDHWYARLVEAGDSSNDVVVRAQPQTVRRLKLKKG